MQKSTCSFSGNERVDLKCTTQELQAEFYLGHKEDCSLEDSTSDSSEKLLQRGGRWGGQYVIVVVRVGGLVRLISGLMASHEEQRSPWRISVLF